MKKVITLCLSSLLMPLAMANQTWVFGTEATFPPFESYAANGKIVGFDADLVAEICKVTQHTCKLENAEFASLLPSLILGKYTAVIGGLGITPARQKIVNFSAPYYQDQIKFVSMAATPLVISTQGLMNKKIAVQSGSTYQSYLAKFYPGVKSKSYDSNLSGLMDLVAGRVDGVLIDEPVYQAWLSGMAKKPALTTAPAANTASEVKFFSSAGDALAVAKGDTKTLHEINQALVTLKKNGVLHKLVLKWFHHG